MREDAAALFTLVGTGLRGGATAWTACDQLARRGVATRVVALPCWRCFDAQDDEYRDAVLRRDVPSVSLEAGATLGWTTLRRRGHRHRRLRHVRAGRGTSSSTSTSTPRRWSTTSSDALGAVRVTRLHTLYERFGQSPWIDNIRRDWLDDGTLAALVAEGVRGVTSNPSIFAKALRHLVGLRPTSWRTPATRPRGALRDPGRRRRARRLRRPARRARRVRGPTSTPGLSGATATASSRSRSRRAWPTTPAATVAAARRLAASVGAAQRHDQDPRHHRGAARRSRAVLGAGINVNVTLIFSVDALRARCSTRGWRGSSSRATNGHDLARARQRRLLLRVAGRHRGRRAAGRERPAPRHDGQRAGRRAPTRSIANGSPASAPAGAARPRGAQVQRPLWASTSMKNPRYDDLLYVDSWWPTRPSTRCPTPPWPATLDHGDFASSPLLDPTSRRRRAAARLWTSCRPRYRSTR